MYSFTNFRFNVNKSLITNKTEKRDIYLGVVIRECGKPTFLKIIILYITIVRYKPINHCERENKAVRGFSCTFLDLR